MLSATSKYALRALVHLARHHGAETAVLGRNLAEGAEIPSQYLSKIMLTLKRAGLVTTARGTGGGYRLARPTQAIPLADVLVLFEGETEGPECLLGVNAQCSETNPCTAHASWRDLRNSYTDFFLSTTVADVSGDVTLATTKGGAGR